MGREADGGENGDCRWLKPVLVAQIGFLEWTGEHPLRHTTFVTLRDDKTACEVRRESIRDCRGVMELVRHMTLSVS